VAAVSPFLALLRKLKKFYGSPSPPKLKGALEIVLWENCAYLADDDRRALAFALLKKSVGLKPGQILDAEPGLLVEVGRFGIVPYESAKKLRLIAEIAHHTFKDDVDSVLGLPLKQAKKELQRFPSSANRARKKSCCLPGGTRFSRSTPTDCASCCATASARRRKIIPPPTARRRPPPPATFPAHSTTSSPRIFFYAATARKSAAAAIPPAPPARPRPPAATPKPSAAVADN
jgi:hypothetical protein